MGSHIPENLEGKDFKFEKLEQKQFLKRGVNEFLLATVYFQNQNR